MKRTFVLVALTLFLVAGVHVFAQTAAPAQAKPGQPQPPLTIAQVLDRQLSNLERDLVPLAEAMPDEKFNFVPATGEFKGVRGFGDQLKHVGSGNYDFAAGILQEKKPAEAGGEDGPEHLKSKAEIVKYLKDSFAYTHRAFATINRDNAVEWVKSPFGSGNATRLGLAVLTVGHGFDHYGQLVEYLRLNGIIPPASRAR